MEQKLVALVPMRHHSVRVPGKNYRPLAGKPLFHHILNTLLAVDAVDQIVVDTDSDLILEGLQKDFPTVKRLRRPEDLQADTIPMNDILLHDTAEVPAAYYLQTHTTNPLLTPETVSRAIQTFFDHLPAYDSLFGVTRLQTRLWDQGGKPVNHDPAVLLRTQDLPPIYEENSCVYIFSRESLVAHQNRLGEHPLMFEIPANEAWDIDEELDFTVAETLYKQIYGEG
jgi:CMP-N-acetylneuraminic acid synthetase